jgi:hypothetical protein
MKKPARRRIDPDDPQKGQWGGRPENRRTGRRLQAAVESVGDGWYSIDLAVVALPGKPALKGPVTFHLHDTFPEPDLEGNMSTDNRRAEVTVEAYGAFTVGAEVKEGTKVTKLELDLANPKLVKAPKAFREA